jgi:hypothetical protein
VIEVVEHRAAAGPGELVEQRLAVGAGVDGAVVADGDRDQVRLVAVEVDLALATLIDAEQLPARAGGRVEDLGLGVEGQTPDVLDARLQRAEARRRAAVATAPGQLEELALGEGAGDDVAVPGQRQRAHRHLPGGRHQGHLPAGDLEDLALVAGAQQHRAVGQHQRAPDAGGVGDRRRAQRQAGPHVAVRVHRDAGQVAALQVVERVEQERPRPHGARRSAESEQHGSNTHSNGGSRHLHTRKRRRGRQRSTGRTSTRTVSRPTMNRFMGKAVCTSEPNVSGASESLLGRKVSSALGGKREASLFL